ncbi:MAG TPA: hypothetical protein VGK67_05215 [Myxococcales bacterium]
MAEKGPAVIDELVQALLADFRREDEISLALPALVGKLGPRGAEALAESLARLSAELRTTILDALEGVAREVGKPLVAPLVRRARPENAKGIGQVLGAILRGGADAEEREELGLRALVAALRSEPERAEALQEVLDAAVAALDQDDQRGLLSHSAPEVQAAAVLHGRQVKEQTLRALARQTDVCVRVAMLRNAMLWRDQKDVIEPFFQDPSPAVRIEACLRAGYTFDGEAERLKEDSNRAVALVARSVLEDEGMLDRIDGALASGKSELRLAACRAAGALEEKDALKVFGALQLDGDPAELRAFLGEFSPEERGSLEQLIRFAKSDPPAEVLSELLLVLSSNDDVGGGLDLPCQLLDRSLPPRVRRLGFEALVSESEGRARRIEPFLVPDEPQVADFLWALYFSTSSAEDEEKALYRRLRGSPSELLAAFAEEQSG